VNTRNNTSSLAGALYDEMSKNVSLSSLVSDPQHLAIAHGLAAAVGGEPDAFFGIKHNPSGKGEPLYTFTWIRGGVLGQAEVVNPGNDDQWSSPGMSACLRPLADVQKVDVGVDVTIPSGTTLDHSVKLKVKAHWPDKSGVILDATGSMDGNARPALEKLIALVLDRVDR